jgi:hypothetical protein
MKSEICLEIRQLEIGEFIDENGAVAQEYSYESGHRREVRKQKLGRSKQQRTAPPDVHRMLHPFGHLWGFRAFLQCVRTHGQGPPNVHSTENQYAEPDAGRYLGNRT